MKRSTDSPISVDTKIKRSKTTDAPIYIYYGYRFFDEENPDKAGTITNHLIVVDDDFKVTKLDLPDIGEYSYLCFNLAVSNSRLHLVTFAGAPECDFNGILSVSIDGSDGTWEKIPLTRDDNPNCFWSVGGIAVTGEKKLIYGMGLEGNLSAFDPDSRTFRFVMSCPGASDSRLPVSIGITNTRIYTSCYMGDFDVLGYYDLNSLTWEMLNPCAKINKLLDNVVVVNDSYLIDFSLSHPSTGEFLPALYVFDIQKGDWLSDPVEGLLNDGHQLPDLVDFDREESDHVYNPSLMEVGRDEQLRVVVFWRDLCNGTEFCMSKFTLVIDELENGAPTFHARDVTSVKPYSFCSSEPLYDEAILMNLKTTTAYD